MISLKERIDSVMARLDAILDSEELDTEEVCKEIYNLERTEIKEFTIQLDMMENHIMEENLDFDSPLCIIYEKYAKQIRVLKKKVKEIKREYNFFDPRDEMRIMFPNGTGDIDYDESWGIGDFENNDRDDDW